MLASFHGGSILPIFRTFATRAAIIGLHPWMGWQVQTKSKPYMPTGLSWLAISWAALPSDGAGALRPARAWDVPEWPLSILTQGHDRSVTPALLERHRYELSESSPTSCDPVSISDSQAWIASTTASSCATVRLR